MLSTTQLVVAELVMRSVTGLGRTPPSLNTGLTARAALPGVTLNGTLAEGSPTTLNTAKQSCVTRATTRRMPNSFQNRPAWPVCGEGWLAAMPMGAGGLPFSANAFQISAPCTYSPSDQVTSLPVFSE